MSGASERSERPGSPVLLLVALGYTVLLLLVWLDELLDFPHLILGAPRVPFSWHGAVLHSLVITVVAVLFGLAVYGLMASRRKAAAEKIELAEKLRIIAEHTWDWAFWQGPGGEFIYASPSCLRITGYAPEEFIADAGLLDRIIHEEDREAYREHSRDTHDRREPGETRFRIVTRDGEVRWLGHVCRPIFKASGEFLGKRGSNRDITAQKLAEEALERNAAHLKHAQEVAKVGSWELDLTGGELQWSEQVYRIFGVEGDIPLDYEAFLARVHEEDRDFVDRSWRAALGGAPYDLEHRIRVGDEVRWVREEAEIVFDEAGRAVRGVGIVQDVTARREAEEDADRLEAELAHVTRIATLGEFSAALAHELNQPLAAILANAQAARRFLAENEPDLDEIREILDDIAEDDQRARDVILRLRDLTKKPTRHQPPEAVRLPPLIDGVLRIARGDLLLRGVPVDQAQPEDLPAVRANAVQLQQALLNLILNALEAMGDRPDRRLSIETAMVNGDVEIAVRDTGPGFEEDRLDDIFKPFTTSKEEGMGMGLAISRAIAETHGGRIRAENVPEGGARVVITLPAGTEDR
jgi:PAS domain S-box-containing protein